MSDLMLAAKAAKAAGLDVEFDPASGKAFDNLSNEWDPRQHDSDALRLAVALGIDLSIDHQPSRACFAMRFSDKFDARVVVFFSETSGCKLAAVRLVIFRVAVDIGRSLP